METKTQNGYAFRRIKEYLECLSDVALQDVLTTPLAHWVNYRLYVPPSNPSVKPCRCLIGITEDWFADRDGLSARRPFLNEAQSMRCDAMFHFDALYQQNPASTVGYCKEQAENILTSRRELIGGQNGYML